MSYEQTGRNLREFLQGFLGTGTASGAVPPTGTPWTGGAPGTAGTPGTGWDAPIIAPYQSGQQEITPSGIGLEGNQAARLKPGDLLLVFNARCWRVDPESGEIERTFTLHREGGLTFWTAVPHRDGYIYCTVSGYFTRTNPIQYATFGYRGAVLRVNVQRREISTVAELVDPVGIQFVDDHHMVIADFNNWESTGQIYIVDRVGGKTRKLADGGLVTEPYRAHLDAEGVLWVANASGLTYQGEVIRINPDGEQQVVVPRKGPYSGVICTVFSSNRPDEVLGVLVDWPAMAASSLFRLDKRTNEVETLISTSPERPGVFSPHVARIGDIVWMTESYHNQLIRFNLETRSVEQTIDIAAITGPELGVWHAWDFVESVAIVPDDWPS